MALILYLETSTSICSVALAKDYVILNEEINTVENSHAGILTILIETVLQKSNVAIHELDAVSVSSGPGSYTGLRIGVSVAKGICHALNIPFIAINTLESMANGMTQQADLADVQYCPLIDARRMEVYSGLYSHNLEKIYSEQPILIESFLFHQYLNNSKIVFFGSGLIKTKSFLNHPNAIFFDTFEQKASNQVKIGVQKHCENVFENIAYFEPEYLKPFYSNLIKK